MAPAIRRTGPLGDLWYYPGAHVTISDRIARCGDLTGL